MITGWNLFLKNIQAATSFNPLDKLYKNKQNTVSIAIIS